MNKSKIIKAIKDNVRHARFDFDGKYKAAALLTNPFYISRSNLFGYIKKYAPALKGSVMDLGCGSKPYKRLFTNCTEYVGVDIKNEAHSHENESIDVYYDGRHLPFGGETFDNVFTSEVLEYVDDMDSMLEEIRRVLKKGGLFLLTTPFVWNENEMPHDFARYSSSGIAKLLRRHGFKIIRFSKSTSYIETLYQMKAEYYRHQTEKYKSALLNKIVQIGIIMPLTLKGLVMGIVMPENDSFYSTNVVLCRRL